VKALIGGACPDTLPSVAAFRWRTRYTTTVYVHQVRRGKHVGCGVEDLRIEGGKVRPSTDALERFAQATRTRLRIVFEPQPSR
jgi:hypothetical protein